MSGGLEFRRERLVRERREREEALAAEMEAQYQERAAADALKAALAEGVAKKSFRGADPAPVAEAFARAYPKRRSARAKRGDK